MDFNSLGAGSPFYILKKGGDKPVLLQGVVKEKTTPQQKYQPQNSGVFNGLGMQHVTNITVTINGNDRIITDIPVNVEIAQRGDETYTGSREAMLQAVDAMVQASRKHISDVPYHKTVVAEGEGMFEVLNPNYAEEKQRIQSIMNLQERADAQDKRLANVEKQNSEILSILRTLNSEPVKAKS